MKRMWALLLSLCLALCLLPAAALAEGEVAKVGETSYTTLAAAIAAVPDGGTVTLLAKTTETINVNAYAKSFSIDKTASNFGYTELIGAYTMSGTLYYTYGYGYEGVTITHARTSSGKVYTYTYTPVADATIAAYCARYDASATSPAYAATTVDAALTKVSGPYCIHIHLKKDMTAAAGHTSTTAFVLFPDGHTVDDIVYTGTYTYMMTSEEADGGIKYTPKYILAAATQNGTTTSFYDLAAALSYIGQYATAADAKLTLNTQLLPAGNTTVPAGVALAILSAKTVSLNSGACLTAQGAVSCAGTIRLYHGSSLVVPATQALDAGSFALPTNYSLVTKTDTTAGTITYTSSADVNGEVQMKIGDGAYETYGTLAEAITAGKDKNATVQLLKDVTAAAQQSIVGVTIDLNGHTLSTAANSFLFASNGTVTILDSSAGGTGKVTGGSSSNGLFVMKYSGGHLNLQSGSFVDTAGMCVVDASTRGTETATLTVGAGASLRSGGIGIYIGKPGNVTSDNVKVDIYGSVYGAGFGVYINGQVTGTDAYANINIHNGASVFGGAALYGAGTGIWNISGGSISGTAANAVEAKAGTWNITGGTLQSGGTQGHTANGNGTSTSGYALTAVDNAGYGGATVTISGGSFAAPVALLDDDTNTGNNRSSISITGGTYKTSVSAYVATGYKEIEENSLFIVVPDESVKPVMTSTPPSGAATIIATDDVIAVTFSEKVIGTPSVAVTGTGTSAAAVLAEDGLSMTITPSGLAKGTVYTFTVTGLTDVSRNPLESNTLTFKTIQVEEEGEAGTGTEGTGTLITGNEDATPDNIVIEYTKQVTTLDKNALDADTGAPSGYDKTTVFFDLVLKINGVEVENATFNRPVTMTVPCTVEAYKQYQVGHLKNNGSVEYLPAVADIVKQTLTFQVTSLSPFILISKAQVVEIKTLSLAQGYVGKDYTQTLVADGAETITWSLVEGTTLPDGLTLAGNVISGKPTAKGSTTIQLMADGGVNSAVREYVLVVNAELPPLGDNSKPWLWAGLILLAGLSLCGVWFVRRRAAGK